MNNATRIAVVAAAFSALAAIACTAAPDETPNVQVEQGTVDPNCIKGGITCGVLGGGSTSGRLTSASSGMVFDPGTSSGNTPPLTPPKGIDPINCGDCRWKPEGTGTMQGCDCGGAGNGLQSGIVCPYSYPCRYYVYGAYRCYAVDSWSGSCH